MAASKDATTAYLSEWAANFKLEDAPAQVVERMKALVLDLLRVVAVGAKLPWSQDARRYALKLGGNATSTVLLYGDRLDAVRAAFVNGSFAHACDLDDTHVGSMHHSGAGRLQASNDAGLSLGAEHKLTPGQIADVEVGIPQVIQGMLTKNDPHDVQSAQLSVPFSLAMALSLGRTRGALAGIRPEDYDAALADSAVRALSARVRCVVDAEIEAKTNTEEVPSRVTIKLADGRRLEAKVDHPRGSPHRPMAWDEISELFRNTVAGTLPEPSIRKVVDIVAGLDGQSTARDITAAFVAAK